MENSVFTIDCNKLMWLILERSECRLVKEGDKLSVYGEDYLVSSLTGNVCLDDNVTSAHQLLDVIYENTTDNFVDDFKYEFGLDPLCEWGEVAEAFEELSANDELEMDDPAAVAEYEAMKLLVMPDAELDAAVDLNKVYDLQQAYWRSIEEAARSANVSLAFEQYMRDRDMCLLPIDTGGYMLYNKSNDQLYVQLEFTLDDILDKDVAVTKNEDGTYHIEFVGNYEPSSDFPFKEYKDYNEAIASCAFNEMTTLRPFLGLDEAREDILKAIKANPVFEGIAEKYELESFLYSEDYTMFLRAEEDIKTADFSAYEKFRNAFQVMSMLKDDEILLNRDGKVLDSIYGMQRSHGDNVFDMQKQSVYKKAVGTEKITLKSDVERD